MKKNTWILLILLSFSSGTVIANNSSQTWKKVLMLSAGPIWSNPVQTQVVSFSPSFPQTYVATSNSETLGNGEIFLGLQHNVQYDFIAQIGLAVTATTSMQLKGDVWQDSDPDFNNFLYSYKISHSHVALRGKLLKDLTGLVQPYVSGSLGVGFNHAYHYIAIPKLFEVAPEPPFASDTTTAFTYTLDIGAQKILNDNWSVGIGYEFADWGATRLGPASSQLSGEGLSLQHVYTNGLQFNVSFVA